MKYLESNSKRQKVEGWLPGAGGSGDEGLSNGSRVSVSQDGKSSGGGWW